MGKYTKDTQSKVGKVDDDTLFEREMETLGTKRSARAAPRPGKAGPAGVTVTEDIDFDALMRGSSGPAKEMPNGPLKPGAGAVEAPVSEAPASVPAPKVAAAIERSRYAATPDEAREFLSAMQGLAEVPVRGEPAGRAVAAADAEDDLARRLKRGDVDSDASLDLHGRTQKEARVKLAAFLEEARQERWRIVTIIVGKGQHSERGQPVLRPLVERWLRDDFRDHVRDMQQAPPYLGGAGAWVVLLRQA